MIQKNLAYKVIQKKASQLNDRPLLKSILNIKKLKIGHRGPKAEKKKKSDAFVTGYKAAVCKKIAFPPDR